MKTRIFISGLVLLTFNSLVRADLICEETCKGTHHTILFKDSIYFGSTDKVVDFKIKCRDQGGVEDPGQCGRGEAGKFGILDYYCVTDDEVTGIGRGRHPWDLVKARGNASDRCYRGLRQQPDCEHSAGVENVTSVFSDCRVEN